MKLDTGDARSLAKEEATLDGDDPRVRSLRLWVGREEGKTDSGFCGEVGTSVAGRTARTGFTTSLQDRTDDQGIFTYQALPDPGRRLRTSLSCPLIHPILTLFLHSRLKGPIQSLRPRNPPQTHLPTLKNRPGIRTQWRPGRRAVESALRGRE